MKRVTGIFSRKKIHSETEVGSPSTAGQHRGISSSTAQPEIAPATIQSTGQRRESSPARESDRPWVPDQDEYGIKILYSPDTPIADIVFVHGLTGGQLSTWTAEDAIASWPKLLLSKDIPEARISAFGYDADIVKLLGQAGQNNIRQHAINLLAGLADMRFDAGFMDLPIIFVAHSLGGLVCENALTIAANAELHQKRILDCTRAIAFLGTPHRGSELASWATIAGNMVHLLKRTNTRILETLKPDSEVLAIVTQEFHTMLRSRERDIGSTISITCYTEELAVSRLGKSFIVVPLLSATLDRYPYKTIHSDHINMTKFGKRDDGYKKVSIELRRWMKDIIQQPDISLNPRTTDEPDEDTLKLLPRAAQAAFNSYEKSHESFCLLNTRVEVMEKIMAWADGHDGRTIFWLNGMAGTGKSTIARTIARDCSDQKRLGASFFFSRGGGEDASHAGKFFTTIAWQLANVSLPLRRYICEAITNQKDVACQTLRDQWDQLIVRPLSKLDAENPHTALVLVIDALDECEGDTDIRLILQLLAEVGGLERKGLRIFLTSRPEIPIRLGFRNMPGILYCDLALHEISRKMVDRDISIFFREKFRELRDDFERLPADWPGDQRINNLVERAGGLFIYAATVCRFVKGDDQWPPQRLLDLFVPDDASSLSPEWKHEVTCRTPTWELDEMYIQILKHSFRKVGERQDKKKLTEVFKQVIGSLTILCEPLPATTLANLLHIRQEVVDFRVRHLHSVLIVPEREDRPMRLLHPSFRDFLLDKQRCHDESFWVDEKKAHVVIFDSCLRLMLKLREDICRLHKPGALTSTVKSDEIERYLPAELQYACLYWVEHLLKSQIQLYDNDHIHSFLRQHLLHWLEALSWMRKTSEGILAIISLESAVLVSTFDSIISEIVAKEIVANEAPRLHAFIYDAKRFALHTRPIMEEAPLQVYCSSLIFAPEKSVVREQFLQMPRWIRSLSQLQADWSPLLQTLAGHSDWVRVVAFSPDGKLVASASGDKTVRLWDPATGAARQTLVGHSNWVSAVAFSPDGKLVASASYDKTVRLWDLATGAVQQTSKTNTVTKTLSFSSDDSYLDTDEGLIKTESLSNSAILPQSNPAHSILMEEQRIVQGMEKLLLLPLDYQVTCMAVRGNIIVLGCTSGLLTIFEFDFAYTSW